MTEVQIYAGTLTASQSDRTATGLLVPYGEECSSNLGRFAVDSGVFSIPADLQGIGLNVEHERENPVGAVTGLSHTAEGIVAHFAFANTREGDKALTDARSGSRRALSAEVAEVVIRAGRAVSGRIFGAALVKTGAFPSATLLAAAADTDTEYHSENSYTDENGVTWRRVEDSSTSTVETDTGTESTTVTTVIVEDTPATAENEDDDVATATVPGTLVAGTTAATPTAPRALTIYEVGVLYARRQQGAISDREFQDGLEGQNGNTLFAALSDVKYNGVGGLSPNMGITPQWLNQVWQANQYRQQVLPLFAHGDLTALTFAGYKYTTKPAGGTWAGNKADIPSNVIVVAPVNGTAARYAIGHDIAREFVDFPVEGFFEGYSAAVTEDYKRWSDLQVITAAIAAATALAGDALATLPGPAGGTIGSTASAIIDGAAAIITTGSLPDFALVATALWKQMAKMPKSNVIGYLNASLGLEEGALDGFTIRPSAAIAAGKVLVGCKSAVTVLELPGSPIRIDALDLVRGGVDKAAFGYCGVNVNDSAGLQLVTAAV